MQKFILKDSQNNDIHLYVYSPKTSPVGVVHIIHGAVEHFARYGMFAEFLNQAGFVAIGCDILGHGLSTSTNDYAHFADKHGDKLAYESVTLVKDYINSHYPGLDKYVLGHSLGSFFARKIVIDYPDEYKKTIWTGTSMYDLVSVTLGILISKMITGVKGPRYLSKFIDNLAIGALAKKAKKAGLVDKLNEGWLTKDETIQEYYHNSPMCGQPMTVSANCAIFSWIRYISLRRNWMRMKKDLPILIASGSKDPISNFGKKIPQFVKQLTKAGYTQVEMRLFADDRHEILNELDREEVYQVIVDFIKK